MAANVLTVMIVAVAVILVRQSGIGRPNSQAVIILAVFASAAMLTAVLVAISHRRKHPTDTIGNQIFAVVMAVALTGYALFTLLVLLGWAVGVK